MLTQNRGNISAPQPCALLNLHQDHDAMSAHHCVVLHNVLQYCHAYASFAKLQAAYSRPAAAASPRDQVAQHISFRSETLLVHKQIEAMKSIQHVGNQYRLIVEQHLAKLDDFQQTTQNSSNLSKN